MRREHLFVLHPVASLGPLVSLSSSWDIRPSGLCHRTPINKGFSIPTSTSSLLSLLLTPALALHSIISPSLGTSDGIDGITLRFRRIDHASRQTNKSSYLVAVVMFLLIHLHQSQGVVCRISQPGNDTSRCILEKTVLSAWRSMKGRACPAHATAGRWVQYCPIQLDIPIRGFLCLIPS